ncbi:cytochrome c-type biogenesis protein [Methylocella sp. CPCC 101449]|jgi:cytochrome c-type biogenesis protein CcmH|uniref:cytochrome c-type biogenesis protein n=1 Tax=Methylocella sp. CPCC 101449 TaxID=2987531 RepID=UPI002891EA20|nr:cytochrome c-type biogenesis protein [Methylocella sp. CPCC 101449]MDT2024230.1 cytochrome c-type biogenesis protein CcmH [Methylocella sp. CPCC 101449]HEV2571259.1 cytochrome c-type biogenesis protein [Beijerinckiaceae bacterium]
MRAANLLRYLLLAVSLFVASTAYAVEPSEMLADQKLEARARVISAGLRCLVCQNQSIDDSNAPLAKDLRVIVRERLVAGDSDDAVRDYLVARYGEFILLKPPLNTGTILLWTATPAILAAALIVVFLRRRRPVRELADELTPEEARKLAELLEKREK